MKQIQKFLQKPKKVMLVHMQSPSFKSEII